VTLTATATPTQPPTPVVCDITFTDVPQGHTFYSSVRCLACRGVISGYADGTFRPDNLVTRSQLAKIVSNAGGFTEDPGAQIFQDVAPGHPFYEWINRLTYRGYMSGYNCGSPGEPCINDRPYFRPFADATRAQTTKIVSNAAMFTEPPVGQTFEDVPSSHPFYEWIQRLASRNIMGGYNCGGPGEPCVPPGNRAYFRPYNNVTRGQSAKIVANTFLPRCEGLMHP
jgi:amidase